MNEAEHTAGSSAAATGGGHLAFADVCTSALGPSGAARCSAKLGGRIIAASCSCSAQGFISRPVTGNRRAPVPVYRTGLTGYRSEPVEFKFEFKRHSSTSSYRYTGRLGLFTGRFDW